VLCYSRLIFVAFTRAQKNADFYRCIVEALCFFGASPKALIVDNLPSAVSAGSGRGAVFHPEFLALCGHYCMQPLACEKGDPESKGVAEGGVKYVKINALAGREHELQAWDDFPRFAVWWRDHIANLRVHQTTGERPVDRFKTERPHLRPLPPIPYDADEVHSTIVSSHARVRFDANRYSVPPKFHRKPVVVRADWNSVRVFFQDQTIATHPRSFEKGRLFVLDEHRQQALSMRRRDRARSLQERFEALGPVAETFLKGLLKAPVKPNTHLRRLIHLARLYGRDEIRQALLRAVELFAFDAPSVENLIHQQRRRRQLPEPLPITPKRSELLEQIDLEEPDPGTYDLLFDPPNDQGDDREQTQTEPD
jgi:hypothetical protein